MVNSLFDGIFGDKRLDSRMRKVFQNIVSRGSSIINRNSSSKTEKIGAYRMINNPKLELTSLFRRLQENCSLQTDCHHVLCIEDTTEINYTQLMHRLRSDDPDVGPIITDSNIGFFCHPTLVLDASNGFPLGYSDVLLWSRARDKEDKFRRQYWKKRIEDKESFRWIESARRSAEVLPSETRKTIIADRESDIYEALYRIPAMGCDYILRSCSDRRLKGQTCLLSEQMRSLPCRYRYEFEVKGSHSRKSRIAEMELRFGSVTFVRPAKRGSECPPELTVNCIHVIEQGSTPSNESPIEWRLLTSHSVETAAEAMQVVEWYKMRWYIEEIFRLLKTQGLDVESVQLESGDKLQKMVVLCLAAALEIMSLKLSYDKSEETSKARLIFSESQIALLKVLLGMVEGKTVKQKNPFKKESLAWAAWIIARLGSWDGYKSQGAPGYITFKRGLQEFGAHFRLYRLMGKDV